MESLHLQQTDAHWGHEPARSAELQLRANLFSINAPSGVSALRFMESLHLQLWTRIGTMNRVRSAELQLGAVLLAINAQSWSSALRFMEISSLATLC